LDFEMSFVTQDDVFAAIEPVLGGVFQEFAGFNRETPRKVTGFPFPRIPYAEALLIYGTDKPDLRNPLRIYDVSEVFAGSDFKVFAGIVAKGGVVRAIRAPNASTQPRSFFDKLNSWAQGEGKPGLGYITLEGGAGKGPIAKFVADEGLAKLKSLTGAVSLDASRGSDAAFDARIMAARPHPGAAESAANLRALLRGSAIRESHRGCGRVQDNYSLRCMPQVHGAARDAFAHARDVLEREINSATDNPLIFAGRGDIMSGGNFHGAPVGLVLDYAAVAATDMASISERRIEKLVNPALSDLPAFLVEEGGINSGLMMAQVAAAALVSECKVLAHPASVDSIPTSAAKEDHVSMSPIAARKLAAIVENWERVLAIELLTAFQAMEFLRPLRSSARIEGLRRDFRRVVRPWNRDRELSPDLERAREFLSGAAMQRATATLR
ncbi:MAG: aromatic amino acid lyase, partial [Acidobacteriota bacterium]